jgi:hypothetical protein
MRYLYVSACSSYSSKSPFFLQVDVVQLQLLQTCLQCALDVMHVWLVDLGGNEELLPCYATLFNSCSELRLSLQQIVLVHQDSGRSIGTCLVHYRNRLTFSLQLNRGMI